jgi:diguanylate cyclase (GGDEF)-like protein/PAS domain S-box-containing protein
MTPSLLPIDHSAPRRDPLESVPPPAGAGRDEPDKHYRQCFTRNALPMWVYDVQTLAFLAVNDAAVAHYGYSRPEFLAMTVADIRFTDDVAVLEAEIARAHRGGATFAALWQHRKKDGGIIDVEVHVTAVTFAGDRPARLVLAQDVTEKRRADLERLRLAAIVESSEDAIIGKTLDGTIVSWNQGAERMYGYAAAETLGRSYALLAPPDERGEPFSRVLERVERGERVHSFEAIRVRKDGTRLDVSLAISPTRNAAGRVVGVSTIARDITERKAAERALRAGAEVLREERDFIKAVMDTAGALVVVLRPDGRVVRINRAAEVTTGYACADVADRHFWNVFLAAEELDGVRAVFAGLLAGDFPNQHENDWLTRTGARRRIAWSNTALLNADGTIKYIIGTGIDITGRRKAEEERERAVRTLQASEERLCLLHDLTSDSGVVFEDKLRKLLHMGRDQFGLEIGFLGRVTDGRFEVLDSVSDGDRIPAGFECARGDTFCDEVVRTNRLVAFEHAGASEWRHHPAYAAFGAEVYFGAPVWVGGAVWGTLCFTSGTPRAVEFTTSDKEFLRLMAQWVGGELTRREAERALQKANAKLEELATRDGLTGLFNRRAFQERLEDAVADARRAKQSLSLLMLDVDHFKQYNDAFGHPAGDAVLRRVARVLEAASREADLVARYGGEEFVILLPNTDAAGTAPAAERLRAAVEAAPWTSRDVTVSVGAATLADAAGGDAPFLLIDAADAALYAAKRRGRNRVVSAGDIADAGAPARRAA